MYLFYYNIYIFILVTMLLVLVWMQKYFKTKSNLKLKRLKKPCLTECLATITAKSTSFSKWQTSDFTGLSSSLVSLFFLFIVFKNVDYFLLLSKSKRLVCIRNKYADDMTYFQLSFAKFSGVDSKGNQWKSDSVINSALDMAVLKVAMVNKYYDFNDYSTPIKIYLDDQLFYSLISGFQLEDDIYINQLYKIELWYFLIIRYKIVWE